MASANRAQAELLCGEDLLQRRVEIWWEVDEKWYTGRVAQYDPAGDGEYYIVYEDGEQHWEILSECRWKLVNNPASAGPSTPQNIKVSTAVMPSSGSSMCVDCGKIFSRGKALGGHRTACKRRTAMALEAQRCEEVDEDTGPPASPGADSSGPAPPPGWRKEYVKTANSVHVYCKGPNGEVADGVAAAWRVYNGGAARQSPAHHPAPRSSADAAGVRPPPKPPAPAPPASATGSQAIRVFMSAGDTAGVGAATPGQSTPTPTSTTIDHARTHPKHLHSIATSHAWALGAIAELLDNAYDEIDKGCTFVKIDVETVAIGSVGNSSGGGGGVELDKALVVTDDGGGMDCVGLHRMLSLGMCTKVGSKLIGQYGNGFKTSTIRLGGSALVFTRTADEMAVGLLSYRFLVEEKYEDVIVPIVGWDVNGHALLGGGGGGDASSAAARTKRKEALAVLTKWTPFKSEAALLAELRARCGEHGTSVMIYHLWQTDGKGTPELDFGDKSDIRTRQDKYTSSYQKNVQQMVQGGEGGEGDFKYFGAFTSLRKYAAVLYSRRKEAHFKIILRGTGVRAMDVTSELQCKQTYTYSPVGLGTYNVALGFVADPRKSRAMGYYVYHRGRLIKILWVPWTTTNAWGRGVIGMLEVDFLEPKHDKQDFDESNGALSKLQRNLATLMKNHWREHCGNFGYEEGARVRKIKKRKRARAAGRADDTSDEDEADVEADIEDDDDDEEEVQEVGAPVVELEDGNAAGQGRGAGTSAAAAAPRLAGAAAAVAGPSNLRDARMPREEEAVAQRVHVDEGELSALRAEVVQLRTEQDELRELRRWKESASRMLSVYGLSIAYPLPSLPQQV